MTTNNLIEHINILRKHNHWRRCNDEDCDSPDCEITGSKELGLAIDAAIEVMQASIESEPVADSDVCDTCHGTGQFCVGRSGSESDGNALEFESCPECGYAEDFGKKPCP